MIEVNFTPFVVLLGMMIAFLYIAIVFGGAEDEKPGKPDGDV